MCACACVCMRASTCTCMDVCVCARTFVWVLACIHIQALLQILGLERGELVQCLRGSATDQDLEMEVLPFVKVCVY
jgi:hypothetical protein